MALKYYDRSILEEEFKRRSARIVSENAYIQRGSHSGYFSQSSRSPDSTYTEVVSKFIHHAGNVKDLVRYVADKEKTESEALIFYPDGSKISRDNLNQLQNYWHKRNIRDTRANARHSTHIVLSTKEEITTENIEILRDVVSNLVSKRFTANGFDSFFTIHTDKAHLHAHVVLHNRSIITGKKIRFSKYSDMHHIRHEFASLLRSKGFHYCATLKKDSMKVLDGASQQKTNQNYVLNQVENELGPTARAWVKKQFILKYSDNPDLAKKAKMNLVLIRNYSDPKARTQIDTQVAAYQKQKEKWDVKKTLIEKYSSFDEKWVGRYVDAVYASQQYFEKRYHSNDRSSVAKYESVSGLVEKLVEVDLSDKIQGFIDRETLKQTRDNEVKAFGRYGDIGRLYLRQLHKNQDFAKTDKQREIIRQKIDDLKKGSVDETEFDYFKNANAKNNFEPFKNFFPQRMLAIKKRIAGKAGVDVSEVTEAEKIFSLYLARRASDSVYAYRHFESAVERYTDILKSGIDERLYRFSKTLDQKLANLPEQKLEIQKKAVDPEVKIQ
ncbi:relaxase/mobilization nuclease domain-containing protein [bacterium]|nr:relaxase/mobilization nuclease domain-containing protein [bacterium]